MATTASFPVFDSTDSLIPPDWMYQTWSQASPWVKTVSPRWYCMTVLAIPVESRNPWTLNSHAFSIVAFDFTFLTRIPSGGRRDIHQVWPQKCAEGVQNRTPPLRGSSTAAALVRGSTMVTTPRRSGLTRSVMVTPPWLHRVRPSSHGSTLQSWRSLRRAILGEPLRAHPTEVRGVHAAWDSQSGADHQRARCDEKDDDEPHRCRNW